MTWRTRIAAAAGAGIQLLPLGVLGIGVWHVAGGGWAAVVVGGLAWLDVQIGTHRQPGRPPKSETP